MKKKTALSTYLLLLPGVGFIVLFVSSSIVMTILEGEGKGSVVETHATPVEAGRTVVVEATLATSDRAGFHHARKLQRFIRPFIESSARRLWGDDAAYAERLYTLRHRSSG